MIRMTPDTAYHTGLADGFVGRAKRPLPQGPVQDAYRRGYEQGRDDERGLESELERARGVRGKAVRRAR